MPNIAMLPRATLPPATSLPDELALALAAGSPWW